MNKLWQVWAILGLSADLAYAQPSAHPATDPSSSTPSTSTTVAAPAPATPSPPVPAPDGVEAPEAAAPTADPGEPPEPKHNEHAAADDEPSEESAAEPENKPKTKITHKSGRYLQFRATDGVKVRMRMVVQPMMRFTRISTKEDFTVDSIIRRARLGFDARLQHGVGLKFELQIKNMRFGLSNMYGTYAPNEDIKIYAGFIKAPGGLERDTYSFDEPFIERSVLAFFTYDHEVGVKIDARLHDSPVFYAASVTRNAPAGVDGGDPEDKPVFPPTVEPDDITRSSSKWNLAGRFGIAPSRDFEASISAGSRLRLDSAEPDFGDRVAEPYDSGFVNPRPWTGVNFHVAADVAVVRPSFRLMAEGGARRDGQQLAIDLTTGATTKLDGNLNTEMGYVVMGWTPNGHYGKAVDNAVLKDGWEIITRIEGARVKPVDVNQILFLGITAGLHWEVSPNLRLQFDVGWQKYNSTAEGTNTGAPSRQIVQLWGAWRI